MIANFYLTLFYSTIFLMTKYLLIVFMLCANVLSAQTTYFTVKATKSKTAKFAKAAKLVKLNLEKACLKNPFISVVDRDLFNEVEREREIQKSESFMDGSYVDQDKAIGASIMILSNYDPETKYLTLNLIDIETNELIFRELYNIKHFLIGHTVEREAYFGRYLEEVMEDILIKLNLSQVIEIQIAKISKVDNNKAKTVLLYCPNECNLTKGQELEVYKENKIENLNIVEKEIVGLLVVNHVETDQVSTAKIKNGGKEIFSIFNIDTKLKCKNASK